MRLDWITTNESEVESLLRRINTDEYSGQDGIVIWVLKHCAKPPLFKVVEAVYFLVNGSKQMYVQCLREK